MDFGDDFSWGAVIGVEDYQRMFAEVCLVECIEESADAVVHGGDHFGIVLITALGANGDGVVEVVGDGVTEGHRVVGEERLVGLFGHEVDEKFAIDVWSVAIFDVGAELAVLPEMGLEIAGAFVPAEEAGLVEAEPLRMCGVVAEHGDLPLAGDGGAIAGVF